MLLLSICILLIAAYLKGRLFASMRVQKRGRVPAAQVAGLRRFYLALVILNSTGVVAAYALHRPLLLVAALFVATISLTLLTFTRNITARDGGDAGGSKSGDVSHKQEVLAAMRKL